MKLFRKWRKCAIVLTVVLISTMLLQGCGLFKPTAASLMGKMLENIQKVNSTAVHTEVDSELQAKIPSIGVGVDGNIKSSSDIELTREPERTKESHTVTFSGLGQNMEVKYEIYTEKGANGTKTTYYRSEGSDWVKQTGNQQSAGTGEGTDDAEESDGSSPESINPVLGALGLLQKMGDLIKEADLKKDLVNINGQEAYQIDFTVGGNLLKELIEESGTISGNTVIDLNSLDWDTVSVPAELYIYKKTKLPGRLRMDCISLGNEVLGSALNSRLEGTMAEGLEMDFRTFVIDMTFDRYDEINEIEIPQEALEAEEKSGSVNEIPGLSDLF